MRAQFLPGMVDLRLDAILRDANDKLAAVNWFERGFDCLTENPDCGDAYGNGCCPHHRPACNVAPSRSDFILVIRLDTTVLTVATRL